MSYSRPFRIFAEKPLEELLHQRLKALKTEVENKPDDYILNVSEMEFANYLVQQHSIHNLLLKPNELSVSTEEKQIPAELFPRFTFVIEGRSYKKDVFKFHLPFEGDTELLYRFPNNHIMWSTNVTIEDRCICFEIINFYDSADPIKHQANEIIHSFEQQTDYLIKEVNSYNFSLPDNVRNIFQGRKLHLLNKGNLLAALGVPLKQRDDYPRTFAIPTPNTRKSISVKLPEVHEKGYPS